jgi:nucleotide-binding universal stress UspA family protein
MSVLQTETQSSVAPRRRKILIAVAFDATSDCALREGMALATEQHGSEVHVVHVVSDGTLVSPEAPLRAMKQQLEQAPELLRARIESMWRETREVEVIGHIRSGSAAEAILQVAADIEADVLVLGTHRRTGLQKLLLGSVAAQVLHGAHCPVLIALPKAYNAASSERIEPACADCLALRGKSANSQFWCERHSRPSLQPHIYVPRDSARPAPFTTY